MCEFPQLVLQTILFYTLRNYKRPNRTTTTDSASSENSEFTLILSIINSIVNIVIQIYKVKSEAKEEVIFIFCFRCKSVKCFLSIILFWNTFEFSQLEDLFRGYMLQGNLRLKFSTW